MDRGFGIGLRQQNDCIVEVVTSYNHCISNIACHHDVSYPFGSHHWSGRFGCYSSFSSKVTQLMDMPSRPGQRYVVAAPRIPWFTFVVQVLVFLCDRFRWFAVAFASAFGTSD